MKITLSLSAFILAGSSSLTSNKFPNLRQCNKLCEAHLATVQY